MTTALNSGSLTKSDRDDFEAAPPPAIEDDVEQDTGSRPFLGIAIGGDTVTQATANLPEDQRILVRWLYDRARKLNWSAGDIAREVGIDRTVVYRIFKGQYTYPAFLKKRTGKFDANGDPKYDNLLHPKAGQPISLDNTCKKIERAKRQAEKAQALFSVGFLETSVWKTVSWACERALTKNRIVFIYGKGQIGKTTCEEEYARLHNGGQTTFVRIPPSGGVQSLLRAVAKALHVSSNKCHDALLEDVINALDKSKLLIFDEIHEIFIAYTKSSVIRCMELLRYIWDKTHCGMVLTGTDVFRDAFKEGQFRELLHQLHRRGLHEVQLPDTTPDEDIRLALSSYGIEWPGEAQAEQELRHLARDGFGQVLMRLEDGKGVADKAGHPYTWHDFVLARTIVRKLTLEAL